MENAESNAKASGSRSGLGMKAAILVVLALAVGAAVYLKNQKPVTVVPGTLAIDGDAVAAKPDPVVAEQSAAPRSKTVLPRLVDLGATKCVPCKMMAPILEELKQTYAGKLEVIFIDVWEKPEEAEKYNINLIPTQIFFDATGKERFRHEGFFSKEDILSKWKEIGVDLSGVALSPTVEPTFSRFDPAKPDTRAKETICYMCDGDINPKSRTVLKTDKGEVAFCSPHCFFITYSSMPENKPAVESVSVTDWSSGVLIPAASAKYVFGVDAKNRPTIKAFGDSAAATNEQQTAGGNIVEWAVLHQEELATTCGFCDRAVYPADACGIKVDGGLPTRGCCTMCALGVAARLQKDIEVTAKDSFSGDPIVVKTMGGHVVSLEPKTAVAWAGTKKDAEGKLVSTGCFKQAFFISENNLMQWVSAHPTATGRMISIEHALLEKMKLTPQQISKACKIGECTPK